MLRVAIGLFFFASVCPLVAGVAPLTVKEVSLMLRSGYSSEVVLQELSKRKFVDALDSAGKEQLVKLGANKSLISTLESGVYQLSAAETAAWEKQKQSTRLQTVSQLSPDLQPAKPTPPAAVQVGGTMYDHLKDDLVYWHEGSLVAFDDETLQRKKLYLLFFSAIWSKEGRQFTAQLVDYYNRVHPQHPEFEIVFFSADRSAFAMENYISQTNMPWPAVAYDKLQGKAGALAGNLRNQIPRLILAEAGGRILSDSGETKPDFDKVLADLDKVLSATER
jgi:Thioredoxin-like